jgi:2'-5' RNA ligase
LFVAVRPPADVRRALHALPRPAERDVRWVPPDQWHVTLRFVGDAEVDALDRALADRFGTRLPAPTGDESGEPAGARSGTGPVCVLGPRVSRLGRSIVCLPAAGLDELATAVREATTSLGEPPDPRPFSGHLTLARLRHRAACGLAGTAFSARFAVAQVELVSSRLSAQGAHHEVVARYAPGSG